eukprot:6582111-Alexandrium_andersonii.AAC.1
MKHRDRMIAYLLKALGLDPNAPDPELFATCQERGGPCAFLVTFATRKGERLEADLNQLQGACAS